MDRVIIDENAKELLEKYCPYEGHCFIHSLNEESVAGKAYAKVSDSDAINSTNIKSGVTILGVEGNYGNSLLIDTYKGGAFCLCRTNLTRS